MLFSLSGGILINAEVVDKANMTATGQFNADAGRHKRSVLLVEDHPLVREVVGNFLNHQDDFLVTGRASTVGEARQVIDRLRPELIVLDLGLPDGHGLELIKDIRAQSGDAKILVFTSYDESIFALRALRAGANGFVMKREPMSRLLEALRQVAVGDYAVNPQVLAQFIGMLEPDAASNNETTRFTRLTDRELEVFELIGKGAGTREIASYLNRSVSAIESCRISIKEKLQLRNGADLVRRAVRWADCATERTPVAS
jgi:DNA-binding NarL/FixJ family response regulator